MNALTQPAKHLVPKYWNLPKVKTTGDLVFLGKVTVRQLIRHWRNEAGSLSGTIKRVEEMARLLKGKTGKDFVKLASTYESPTWGPSDIGWREDGWGDDPEPLDAASINRQSDSTTFNVCGWCKYAGGGSCRYQYHITTSCSFLDYAGLPDHGRKIPFGTAEKYMEAERANSADTMRGLESEWPGLRLFSLHIKGFNVKGWANSTQRRFNTPCFLQGASMERVQFIYGALMAKKWLHVEQKKKIDSDIKLLLDLEKLAEKKPALPDQRPHDWFNVNDEIACFVGNWDDRIYKDVWAFAKVIYGYRHQDGCVSVRYNEKIHNGPYLEGHGGGYGMSRPEVMHMWEFNYLRQHPDFAKLWVRATNGHLEGYDPDLMLEALSPKE